MSDKALAWFMALLVIVTITFILTQPIWAHWIDRLFDMERAWMAK